MKPIRQFHLIGLFQITTVAAFGACIAAPLIRPLFQSGTNLGELEIAASWFAILQFGGIAVMAACTLYLRRRMERRGGRRVYYTSGGQIRPVPSRRIVRSLAGLLPVPFAMLFLFMIESQSWWTLLHPMAFGIQALVSYEVARCGRSILLDIDYDDIEICEHGLIHGAFQFWAWSDIASIESASQSPDKILLIWADGRFMSNVGATTTIRLPTTDRKRLIAAAAPFVSTSVVSSE